MTVNLIEIREVWLHLITWTIKDKHNVEIKTTRIEYRLIQLSKGDRGGLYNYFRRN